MLKIPRDHRAPRNGLNSEKPGCYELITRNNTPIIDRGDYLEFEQYITGYGFIGESKLVSYPSVKILDSNNSYIQTSIGKDANNQLTYGVQKHNVSQDGFSLEIRGVKGKDWESDTLFFDMTDSNIPQVSTERKIGNCPPIIYRLKAKRFAKPGEYNILSTLTYYNGREWKSSTNKISFKIRNIFERHEAIIALLAITATVSAIWRFAIKPIIAEL